MEKHAPRRFPGVAPSKPASPLVRLRLIQLAGGDPAFAATLRAMIWQAYCDAGRPLGPAEEGMFLWFEQQLFPAS